MRDTTAPTPDQIGKYASRRWRHKLRLERGDRLEVSIDEVNGSITIAPVAGIEALSARISGYAAIIEPVTNVDAYYQANRHDGRDQ